MVVQSGEKAAIISQTPFLTEKMTHSILFKISKTVSITKFNLMIQKNVS